jgi:formate-dependent nitrite reductase membrane component NrfD
MPLSDEDPREERLDELKQAARAAQSAPRPKAPAGYYGRPIVKPPVWTWEIPLYFFVGGTAGMSAVIALACVATHENLELARAALWLALGGALLSPLLLVLDLGRPARFLNMLRVLKLRSPMSVGAWTLVLFSTFTLAAVLVFEGFRVASDLGVSFHTASDLLFGLTLLAGAMGALLATYTGVLLGMTAVPAWHAHRYTLPLHFGIAGLGAAAALLELMGFRLHALDALGAGAAALETVIAAWIELYRHGAADRALHRGTAAALLRTAGVLSGPLSLALRLGGLVPAAAASFVLGALLSRYAWVIAGRASAGDPRAALPDAA